MLIHKHMGKKPSVIKNVASRKKIKTIILI